MKISYLDLINSIQCSAGGATTFKYVRTFIIINNINIGT